MDKIYLKIDIFLLKKFQWITDFFQKWFSCNGFTLARFCLVIFTISALMMITSLFTNGNILMGVQTSFLVITPTIVFFLLLKRAESDNENERANANEIILFKIRKISLILLFFSFLLYLLKEESSIKFTDFIFIFSAKCFINNFFLFSFLVSCNPKPPSKNKFYETIKSLFKQEIFQTS